VWYIVFNPLNITDGNQKSSNVENITLIVDYANLSPIKIIENFNLTKGNTSVFHALMMWCEIEYILYPGGSVFIIAIDGIKNNVNLRNYYWFYYVNDNYAQVGAAGYYLENGDIIKWNYTLVN
jgi:hypothetical protein